MKKSALPYAQVVERRESRVHGHSRWFPPVISSAKGSVLRDINGESYIDFLAGAGALNYGHNDPDLQALLIGYLGGDGIVQSLDMVTESKTTFLLALEQVVLTPRRLDYRSHFTGPTGANAVAAALALARRVTRRRHVIAFSGGFHGLSLGERDSSESATFATALTPCSDGVTRVPYDGQLGDGVDTSVILSDLLDDPSGGIEEPAAILVETVQGEGGLYQASPAWMQSVAEIARRHGALLIVDDVQAGCGRTGTFFSFEPLGIQPDIVVLSKSLSGFGLPMSMLLIDPAFDQWAAGDVHGTFRGNGAAFVTATGALRKFWRHADTFEADVARRSALTRARLDYTAEQVPGLQVRGRGMMLGLDVGDATLAERIQMRCVGHGLLIERAGQHRDVLKVLAPLTTEDAILDRGLEILHRSVVGAALADQQRLTQNAPRRRSESTPATADTAG